MNKDINKEIIWDGEPKTIPGYGEVKKGVSKCLPKDLADSFVNQKLAHHKRSTGKKSTSSPEEG